MANFTLTVDADTVAGGAADDTVSGTSATLNAGDGLTGGVGTDALVLAGSGIFHVDQLASFTGFERIRLDNATNFYANLYLGNQAIEVDATGYLAIQVSSPSNWNSSNIINGDASHTWNTAYISFYNNVYPQLPITYDLTSNTLSHVNINGVGDKVTLLVNNANTAGIQSITGFGQNAKLATAGSTLDLSHTTVAGLPVISTNSLGTTFTVGDLGTASQIAGGAGQDTIIASGFTFSADQRNTIFSTASIEKIVDQSGTYVARPTITSDGGGDTAAVSIVENTTAVTTVTASANVGETLSYTITDGADASRFAIDSATGALSFITAPDFEIPADAGGDNVYDVAVQVSDGHGGIDTQALAVTVTNVFETLGPEYTIENIGSYQSVTQLTNGRFVVARSSSRAEEASQIYGKIFDASTVQNFTGSSKFWGPAQWFMMESAPVVAALPDGRFAIAWGWGDILGDVYNISGITTNVFDSSGTIIGGIGGGGSRFPSSIPFPTVSALANGGLLTWAEAPSYNTQSQLHAAVFNAGGTLVSGGIIVNSTPLGAQFANTSAAGLPDGRFIVTWDSGDGGDGDGTLIRARLFNASGAPTGNDFVVDSTSRGNQFHPAVAALPNHFVVTWQSDDGGDGDGTLIRARLFDASGAPAGNDFVVNTTAAGNQYFPSVAALPSGDFVVTWRSDDSSIHARLFNASGTPKGNDFIIDSAGSSTPTVTALQDGHFQVAWTSGTSVHVLLLDPNGTGVTVAGTADGEVITGSPFADQLAGLGGTDTIRAGDGDDTLVGGTAADVMLGGPGNDAYSVDNAGDVVVENANEGNDAVFSTVHFALAANVDNLVLQGSADLQGYGNSLSNLLYGNTGNNILNGGAGADAMFGGAGNDAYFVDDAGDAAIENFGEGVDTVYATAHFRLSDNVENLILQGNADLQGYGNSLSNLLYGNTGNNILNGGAVADAMFGGAGNDAYFVDDAGDAVIENFGEGVDTVYATAHFRLSDNVENLILQGNANLQGYGNSLSNLLYGNSGNNILNGDAGADGMIGGAGNDAYFVDDSGDQVIESPGEGNDTVYTSIHYRLTANVENLILQGSANLQGYGNNLNNALYGNTGDNILNGDAGADVMVGGAGNDVYFVDNAGDQVIESMNQGTDAVFATVSQTLSANVETLVLQGSSNLSGSGNSLANKLYGNSGDNTLNGGAGADLLTGNGGNDLFVFNVGQADGDTIVDFAGNGAASGDSLHFAGYGPGATFTNIDSARWQINYNGGLSHDIITFSNAASIDATDYLFV
jgi:Ca2+-binding RTX toxin-like protein